MSTPIAPDSPTWPLAIYFLVTFFLVILIPVVSYFLGQRHRRPPTDEVYDGGLVPTGSARVRFAAKFYLMAMFFVVFDMESAFILAWSVAARELGWTGYIEVSIFIGILLAALLYLWRVGALDWGTPKHREVADGIKRRRLV